MAYLGRHLRWVPQCSTICKHRHGTAVDLLLYAYKLFDALTVKNGAGDIQNDRSCCPNLCISCPDEIAQIAHWARLLTRAANSTLFDAPLCDLTIIDRRLHVGSARSS
jgi:hypothetical protein